MMRGTFDVERRVTQRNRCYLGGVIRFSGLSTLDCLVTNLSADGARVVCSQQAILPSLVFLEITKRRKIFQGNIIWNGYNEFGMRFIRHDYSAKIIPFPQRVPL
ncbi:PilZ domain-containing protein [Methylocystis heyeri]|uniref:PilZ domain-containing protein n=1 Tax=Methylocystis heyeri TaxID=391905 RepID=A0A6B8KBS0_9HYPH|nr:PilZ domain-containing protein [Methylocystis heyeri]QGM45002.1 hypothetical protein H2LOC_004475 [Methylocystis heyeri]